MLSNTRNPSKEERRTLVALARTCRAFSEPSLDCLWRDLDSLLPLVQCFSDVADEDRVEIPPSSREWLAIDRCSPRIRELTLGNEPLSLRFLQCIGFGSAESKGVRMEISLRVRHPSTFHVDSIAFLRPLLTPKIVTLEVDLTYEDGPKCRFFLKNYPVLCPIMKSIKFSFPFAIKHGKSVSQAFSSAICGNADGQNVELSPPIDDIAIKHLGMYSTLRRVFFTTDPSTPQPHKTYFARHSAVLQIWALVLLDPVGFVTRLLRPCDQMFRRLEVS
ncbi:hypothetical protein JVT61DRAFT_8662 [Boletus reticuloceps]|uniref:F-box domain-containing protein n=1 Tax=Boletus reticuloceps TaxID=495285 RepID=A0A8I2Z0I2_9AGAM|nr:hypothetical protein JVT61DRAFT_8662 [Boletus reticuloceps]